MNRAKKSTLSDTDQIPTQKYLPLSFHVDRFVAKILGNIFARSYLVLSTVLRRFRHGRRCCSYFLIARPNEKLRSKLGFSPCHLSYYV